MLRTKIEFSCDMPYDAVEGDGGEFVEMPARTVAQAMADILAGLDCAVEPVESAGDHGWIFWFRSKSAEASCEVTAIDGIVAQFAGPDGRKSWLFKAGQPNPDYVEILDKFGTAMAADGRFRDLGWFAPEELTSGQAGAPAPTAPYDSTPCRRTFGLADGRVENELPLREIAQTAVSGEATDDGWEPAWPPQRLAARMFDHIVIVGGALSLLIWLLRIPPPISAAAPAADYNVYFLLFGVAVGGGVMNAVLIPKLSTTPGKWLCQVRVEQADRTPLSHAAALKREAEVALAGYAMFIPILMPITIAVSFLRWMYRGSTGWDQRRGSVVVQAPLSGRGFLATVFCLASSFAMFFHLLRTWSGAPITT